MPRHSRADDLESMKRWTPLTWNNCLWLVCWFVKGSESFLQGRNRSSWPRLRLSRRRLLSGRQRWESVHVHCAKSVRQNGKHWRKKSLTNAGGVTGEKSISSSSLRCHLLLFIPWTYFLLLPPPHPPFPYIFFDVLIFMVIQGTMWGAPRWNVKEKHRPSVHRADCTAAAEEWNQRATAARWVMY